MTETRVWTSRKFTSAWFLTMLFTLLLCFGKLPPEHYSTCISFVWIGYFASNVGSKLAGKKNEP